MKPTRHRFIHTVLFDMGGVLATDVSERILFDRQYGLAPHNWLARRRWARAITNTWRHAELEPNGTAARFWAEVSERVGRPIALQRAAEAEAHVLQADPSAARLMSRLVAAGIRVGVVSDNTPYWYKAQLAALQLLKPFDPTMQFLSFQQGVSKRHGLYRRAAEYVSAPHTLVIEDRLPLRRAARAAGFHVARYHWRGPSTLEHVLAGYGLLPPAHQ